MTDEIDRIVEVTQADREAANLAFNVWGNTNELALAFAHHRKAAIAERDAQIVAWLREDAEQCSKAGDKRYIFLRLANAIERGEVGAKDD